MKHFVIYKTTNLVNKKIYVGIHETSLITDSYIGSGTILKKAINKYGKENFEKQILYVYPTKKEALSKEAEIVNEEFIKREDVYNIKLGGEGGWDYINNLDDMHPVKINRKKQISKSIKELYDNGTLTNKFPSAKNRIVSDSTREKMRLNNLGELNNNALDKELFKQRIKDHKEIKKSRGYISKLSKKWGISHTQVRRFIDKHNME